MQPILKATLRQSDTKVKALRRENMVPGVIYSRGTETQSITMDVRELDRMLRTFGRSTLFSVEVDGETTPALVREVQRDTLRDIILHVDFLRVSLDEEIQFDLPIVLVGDAAGLKEGGVLQQQKRSIGAMSLARDMPDNVEIDISALEIGDTLTVGDIDFDEKLEILDEPEEVIVSVLAPMMEEEEEEEVDELEEIEGEADLDQDAEGEAAESEE